MIASVSTLARSSGATSPVNFSNFCIIFPCHRDHRVNLNNNSLFPLCALWLLKFSNIHEMPGDSRGGRHRRAHEVRTTAGALASLEIAVRRRGAALARFEPVGVHGQTHRASRFTPFETGVRENSVQ